MASTNQRPATAEVLKEPEEFAGAHVTIDTGCGPVLCHRAEAPAPEGWAGPIGVWLLNAACSPCARRLGTLQAMVATGAPHHERCGAPVCQGGEDQSA